MKDKELKNWVRQAAEEFGSPPETEARLRAQVLSMQPAPKPKAPVWRRALAGGLVGAAALPTAVYRASYKLVILSVCKSLIAAISVSGSLVNSFSR